MKDPHLLQQSPEVSVSNIILLPNLHHPYCTATSDDTIRPEAKRLIKILSEALALQNKAAAPIASKFVDYAIRNPDYFSPNHLVCSLRFLIL